MSKTVRVEIETDDGTVSVLEGDAADVWQRQIDHAGSMASVHGSQFEELPWKDWQRGSGTVAVRLNRATIKAVRYACETHNPHSAGRACLLVQMDLDGE